MNINNSPWPYIIIMRETNACLCTLKTKNTSRIDVFCETFGHVCWGISLRRRKITSWHVGGALGLVFCLKLFLHLSPPHQEKGVKQHVCVCVCVLFSSCYPHCVFSSCLYTKGICFMFRSHKKKTGCATGSTTLHFHALKIAGLGESSTSLYCFHALKTTMKTTKKIQHNIWHTLHDSNILLSNIRSLRSKSWNGYWEISWLWKLNESKRREGLEGFLLGRVPHWEGWDVGFAVKYCTRWCFWIFFIFTPSWGNDLIWQAYFSNGWFNHQLGNPSTLNPYSRQTLERLVEIIYGGGRWRWWSLYGCFHHLNIVSCVDVLWSPWFLTQIH